MGNGIQTGFDVIKLYGDDKPAPQVTKVGILPFVVDKEWRVMVMKPHAEAIHLGAPTLQIAKGTRRININGNWCDMRDDDLIHADESFYETLVGTALREGEEEIGLKASNISRLFDMGGFSFISASRKTIKPLHMFAAQISDEKDFGTFEATTGEVRWITNEEFATIGRADHVTIVKDIVQRLQKHFGAQPS